MADMVNGTICRLRSNHTQSHLPIILEKDARVPHGTFGFTSNPLNSWIRFSASCKSPFKCFPNDSATRRERKKRIRSMQNCVVGSFAGDGCVLTVKWIRWANKVSNKIVNLFENWHLHLLPSMAPFCSSILVRDRLLLNTATSNGDNPSLFKLHTICKYKQNLIVFFSFVSVTPNCKQTS